MTRPRTSVAAVAGALVALLALLVLAGCGTGSSEDLMGGESMAEPMMDDATMRGQVEEVAGGAMDSTSASTGDGDMSVDAADVAEAATEEGAEGAREAAIISTGTVSLRADDVGDARFEVQKVVDRVGGQVTDSETRTDDDGEVRTARLVLRVPSAEFTETIDALEKVADLEASSTTSEDVTSQVVDTDVRIRVQRQSIARIEQLLDRAGSIRDIVAVERQLTDREARLNSLLRQQAYLADQTSMSTITVHLQRHPSEEPEEEDGDDGFLAGLSAGWEALGTVAVGLATVAGAVLPFAVLALVLGLPGWLLLRGVVRRRRTPGTVAAQPAAPAEG